MNIARIRHLLSIATHRMVVSPQKEPTTEPPKVRDVVIKSARSSKGSLKKQLVALSSENRNGQRVGMALAYNHFLKNHQYDQANLVRSCFSKEASIKFLIPIEALNGNLPQLKKVSHKIGCTPPPTQKHYPSLPLSVAYGLLSKNPKTIGWCLSSFFDVEVPIPSFDPSLQNLDIETTVIGNSVYQQHMYNILSCSNGVSAYKEDGINLFWTVLEEKDKAIRQAILECIAYLPEQKLEKQFLNVWSQASARLLKENPSSAGDYAMLKTYTQEVFDALSSCKLSSTFLENILFTLAQSLHVEKAQYTSCTLNTVSLVEGLVKKNSNVFNILPSSKEWDLHALLCVLSASHVPNHSLKEQFEQCTDFSQMSSYAKTVLERFFMKEETKLSQAPKQKAKKM